MEWFVFVLVAITLWSLKNIVDKVYLSKMNVRPSVLTFLMLIFNFGYVLLLTPFFELNINIMEIWPAIILGIFGGLSFMLYSKAISKDDLSRSFAISQISPIFVILLEVIFLSEMLGMNEYLGIVLLVLGAIALSIKDLKTFEVSPAIGLAILMAIFYACYSALARFGAGTLNAWTLLFWSMLTATLISSIALIKEKNRKNLKNFFTMGKKKIGIYLFSVSFSVVARFSYLSAMGLASASLVAGLAAIQPLIVLIFTVLASLFIPNILKESLDKKSLLFKFVGVVLIIVGTILVI
jgi:uncharacterized membrane protein